MITAALVTHRPQNRRSLIGWTRAVVAEKIANLSGVKAGIHSTCIRYPQALRRQRRLANAWEDCKTCRAPRLRIDDWGRAARVALLALGPVQPEVLKTVDRETVADREPADRTLTMQSVERHINEAALTALCPLYLDLDHDRLSVRGIL